MKTTITFHNPLPDEFDNTVHGGCIAFKILNYIFVKVPKQSSNYELSIPYNNYLWYNTGLMVINKPSKQISNLFPKEYLIKQGFYTNIKQRRAIPVKYILFGNPKFRYHIIGKIFDYVIIKIN